MRQIKPVFLIILLFWVPFQISAQSKDSAKIYFYEPFNPNKTIDTKKDIKIDQNCLKWNWTLLGRGIFALNYERLITSTFSFELGAGLTYKDLYFEQWQEAQDEYSYSAGDNRKIKMGPYLEANLRFYPTEGDLEGFYISPFFRYRKYNNQSLMSDDNWYSTNYTMNEIGLNFGIQSESWLTGLMVDSYFGIRYGNRVMDVPESNYINSGYIVDQVKTKKWMPGIMLGAKIGLPF
jgi:hypothetical protein